MNSDEAKELRQQWGDTPCDHPDIKADCETDGGDNWRCIQCGRLVDFDEWERSRKGDPIKPHRSPIDPRD